MSYLNKNFLITAIICLVAAISVSTILAYVSLTPNPGHTGLDIYININNKSLRLQQAIDTGEFDKPFYASGDFNKTVVNGHLGSEVIVNINGSTKNFQESINDGSLCTAHNGTSIAFYNKTLYGNFAKDILVNVSGVEKNLQQAINEGDFNKCHKTINLVTLPGVKTFESNREVKNSLAIDQDLSTYVGAYRGFAYSLTWSVEFPEPVDVKNISTKITASHHCRASSATIYFSDGSIQGIHRNPCASFETIGDWKNVKKIEIYDTVKDSRDAGPDGCHVYIYEVSVIGQN